MKDFNVHLRPICISCSLEMACSSNGVYVRLKGSHAYILGDLYRCEKCKNSVVTGFAKKAFGWDKRPGLIVAEIDL